MTSYPRAFITGTLTTESDLHIGSGEEKEQQTKEDSDQQHNLINEIIRGPQGRPYIPASSLRGFLRSQIVDPYLRQALFGLARQPAESEEKGRCGHLRLYDALLRGCLEEPPLVSRTAIDPVTQAAKAHHLSTHEVIPPGKVFDVRLELDNSTEEEIAALLQALSILNGLPNGKLGKGKSIGQGRLCWESNGVSGLTRKALETWLRQPIPERSAKNKRKKSKTTENVKSYQSGKEALEKAAIPLEIAFEPAANPWETFTFTLHPQSPLLINDPQRVEQRKTALEKPPPLRKKKRKKG